MGQFPNPVIVVPGIIATYLRDEYPLPPETVWTVLTKDFTRSSLHPDDLRYKAQEPARVVPDQIYEIAYSELIEELRHGLTARPDQPVPVYPFGYDWRQPLVGTERRLAAFIDEVIARTVLLRHYFLDGYADNPRVNLVGHSMGGLVIAGCLEQLGNSARVGKVVTLAAPFRGSFESVVKVTTGTASLGGDEPSSRERETARLTPALYHLIPSMAGGLDMDDPAMGSSLYDPALWQPSIVSSIAQYIEMHGRQPAGAAQQAPAVLAGMLTQAKAHRDRIEALNLASAGLTSDDWLCVAGADCDTRVRLHIAKSSSGAAEFDLRSADRMNQWSRGATDDEKRLTGDGTVPLEGAIPGFLQPENLVVVTPDDFGYWEIQDKLTAKAAGFHGIMPNMNMLHRLIVRHFTGQPDTHKNTWGTPVAGISAANWKPAITGLQTA